MSPSSSTRVAGPTPADPAGQTGGELAAVGRADEAQHLVGVGPDLPGGRAGPPAVPRAGVSGVVIEHVTAGHQPASWWRRSAAINLASTSASSPLRRSSVWACRW
jgi:hypothetical protein